MKYKFKGKIYKKRTFNKKAKEYLKKRKFMITDYLSEITNYKKINLDDLIKLNRKYYSEIDHLMTLELRKK